MKKIIKSVLAVSILAVSSIAGEIKNLSEALDVSGEQQMATQVILRDYMMLSMGNSFENKNYNYKNNMNEFDSNLNSLLRFNEEENTESALLDLRASWHSSKKLLNRKPNHVDAVSVRESLKEVLNKSEIATKLFDKQFANNTCKAINVADKQRMLAQKIAADYMFLTSDIKREELKAEMTETMISFEQGLVRLSNCERNTPELKKLLGEVTKSFAYFKVMSKSKDKYIPSIVSKKSSEVMETMNKIIDMYIEIRDTPIEETPTI